MTNNTCPYCGQAVMGEGDPRESCTCDKAFDYRELISQADEAFAEEDNQHVFRPVDGKTYSTICSIVDGVASGVFGYASFTLGDGSKCKITRDKITREKNVKMGGK